MGTTHSNKSVHRKLVPVSLLQCHSINEFTAVKRFIAYETTRNQQVLTTASRSLTESLQEHNTPPLVQAAQAIATLYTAHLRSEIIAPEGLFNNTC